MRPRASSAPVIFRVRRHFEANRLAGACQVLAYEHALPMDGETVSGPSKPAEDGAEIESSQAKGVAA